ncbi:hypothetical protein ACOME3_008483 [Neoechinorhynchus agilis]
MSNQTFRRNPNDQYISFSLCCIPLNLMTALTDQTTKGLYIFWISSNEGLFAVDKKDKSRSFFMFNASTPPKHFSLIKLGVNSSISVEHSICSEMVVNPGLPGNIRKLARTKTEIIKRFVHLLALGLSDEETIVFRAGRVAKRHKSSLPKILEGVSVKKEGKCFLKKEYYSRIDLNWEGYGQFEREKLRVVLSRRCQICSNQTIDYDPAVDRFVKFLNRKQLSAGSMCAQDEFSLDQGRKKWLNTERTIDWELLFTRLKLINDTNLTAFVIEYKDLYEYVRKVQEEFLDLKLLLQCEELDRRESIVKRISKRYQEIKHNFLGKKNRLEQLQALFDKGML